MAQVPSEVLVVLDEAYWEFNTAPDAVDGLTALKTTESGACPDVSKAHGLAGLRVGYTVAQPEVTAAIGKPSSRLASLRLVKMLRWLRYTTWTTSWNVPVQ